MNIPTKFDSKFQKRILKTDNIFLTTLGLLFLEHFRSTTFFRRPFDEHSYQVWFQLAQTSTVDHGFEPRSGQTRL